MDLNYIWTDWTNYQFSLASPEASGSKSKNNKLFTYPYVGLASPEASGSKSYNIGTNAYGSRLASPEASGSKCQWGLDLLFPSGLASPEASGSKFLTICNLF